MAGALISQLSLQDAPLKALNFVPYNNHSNEVDMKNTSFHDLLVLAIGMKWSHLFETAPSTGLFTLKYIPAKRWVNILLPSIIADIIDGQEMVIPLGDGVYVRGRFHPHIASTRSAEDTMLRMKNLETWIEFTHAAGDTSTPEEITTAALRSILL